MILVKKFNYFLQYKKLKILFKEMDKLIFLINNIQNNNFKNKNKIY